MGCGDSPVTTRGFGRISNVKIIIIFYIGLQLLKRYHIFTFYYTFGTQIVKMLGQFSPSLLYVFKENCPAISITNLIAGPKYHGLKLPCA
jgi:hypothetical protein